METLKALNKKKIKELLKEIEEQYSINDLKLDYVFFKNSKDRVFLMSNSFKNFEHDKMHINSLGLYFANLKDYKVRLSVEGSQLIGNKAKKNVVELNENELRKWLRGEDLENKEGEGFVIVKHENDFYGSGRISNNKLLNFIPKEKRVEII